jgi:hypothetical protein
MNTSTLQMFVNYERKKFYIIGFRQRLFSFPRTVASRLFFRSTFLCNENDSKYGYAPSAPPQQQSKPNRYFKPMTVASPVDTVVVTQPMTGGPGVGVIERVFSVADNGC